MIRRANEQDYDELFNIWESSVKATHDFLLEEDFNYYQSRIKTIYFCEITLYAYISKENVIQAFIGVKDNKIEMLFVHNSYRNQGIGKELLQFAISKLNIKYVDVNEQNTQAVEFYKKNNFIQNYYSEIDYDMKPYPIIGMILND